MQVLKFGGTSVANAENMGRAIAIIEETLKKDSMVVVFRNGRNYGQSNCGCRNGS